MIKTDPNVHQRTGGAAVCFTASEISGAVVNRALFSIMVELETGVTAGGLGGAAGVKSRWGFRSEEGATARRMGNSSFILGSTRT